MPVFFGAIFLLSACSNILRAQDTLRIVKHHSDSFLIDQRFVLYPLAQRSISIPALEKIDYRRPGKSTTSGQEHWFKLKKEQKEIFESLKWNYSTDSGLDPSFHRWMNKEKSLWSDLNSGNAIEEQKTKIAETSTKYFATQPKLSMNTIPENGKDALVVKSEKLLRKYYDSLIRKDIQPPKPPAFMQQKEVSQQDMVNVINKEFNSATRNQRDSLQRKWNDVNQVRDTIKNVTVSDYKLAQIEAANLKPLSGNLLDSEVIQMLDSIRDINLLKEGYSYKEQLISQQDKLATLKEKQSFFDRSYFEGLIGLQQNELMLIQLTPAWGYNLGTIFSAGAGPNLTLSSTADKSFKIAAKASARTFIKAELWKQRVYLQAEDGIQWVTKETKSIEHSILTGAGGLLPFSKSLALNVALLYRVYSTGINPSSPWVIRLGISTVKSKEFKKK